MTTKQFAKLTSTILIFCSCTFVNLFSQEVTSKGAGILQIGMSIQQMRLNFPNAKFAKEIYEASDDPNSGIIIAKILDSKGRASVKLYFYKGKISSIDFFSIGYRINNIAVGSTFKELIEKKMVKSIDYAPDGEGNRIGLWVVLKDFKNIETKLKISDEVKIKLKRYEYKEVPVNHVPLDTKIESIRLF